MVMDGALIADGIKFYYELILALHINQYIHENMAL